MLLLLCVQSSIAQKLAEVKKLEALISRGIEKSFASSVRICAYDTLSKRTGEGGFSGVVVTAEGHILTVAHATKPNEVYQVTFPDGTEYLATGLGRMAIKKEGRDLDMAMIKMLKPGKWPFAEMGSNANTKVYQPALSISYPGSFDGKQPNVRFGQFTNVDISSGYITSSCKMEPGDSGGPLFDIEGRVLALHSWIRDSEEENFEVPVDLYKKYWTALNVAKDYQELPEPDQLNPAASQPEISVIPGIQQLAGLSEKSAKSVVGIISSRGGTKLNILGSVVECSAAGQNGVYILSKSSAVADSVKIMLNGKSIPAGVYYRDKDNDLVLLKPVAKMSGVTPLKTNQEMPEWSHADLGHFLVTALAAEHKKVGVLSTEFIDMPMRFSVGHFGANARFIDQKITITDIQKGSASAGFLKLQDQVTAINGVSISRPPEYGAELMKYLAGDSISIDAVRDGKPIRVKMYLPAYPGADHVASHFEGGRSARSDGFKKVFVQDAAIKAEECGSPVFDAEGRFRGINIARHSRTSAVVMPADVVADFIQQAVKRKT